MQYLLFLEFLVFSSKTESWYKKEGGPVIDMGPYFFTTLVNLLGPAKQVQGRTLTAFKRIYGAGAKKVNILKSKLQQHI